MPGVSDHRGDGADRGGRWWSPASGRPRRASSVYFMAIDQARFRRPVRAGRPAAGEGQQAAQEAQRLEVRGPRRRSTARSSPKPPCQRQDHGCLTSMADVHPTAIVDPRAELADDVAIGPYCVVGAGCPARRRRAARIACRDHRADHARRRLPRVPVRLSRASAAGPANIAARPTELVIGRDNPIREHVTMHPGTAGGGGITRVGDDGLFMAAIHVAHDCQVGDGVIMANNATLGGHVEVQDHAFLGGLCAVHQFVRIGRQAMIGGLSGVEHDVIPYGMVIGNRAQLNGLNIVGMQRRGFARDEIQALRTRLPSAVRAGGRVRRAARARSRASSPATPRVMEIIGFIRERRQPRDLHAAAQNRHRAERWRRKLGVLAGSGPLPGAGDRCRAGRGPRGLRARVRGRDRPERSRGVPHRWVPLGAVGRALEALRAAGVEEVVLIGAGAAARADRAEARLARPAAPRPARPARRRGDDQLLRLIVEELEGEGFRVIGADDADRRRCWRPRAR